jgi:hemin uptake protein HemP
MADSQTPDTGKNPALEQEAQQASHVAGHGRTIRSEDLFAGQRVVLIQHAGEEYRLMITRNDRLILQK